jgi:hypothetical protein
MSIIVILMSIMMPSLAAIRRYSKVLKQKGQFHDISTGLEMFSIDFDGYPDSKGTRTAGGSPGWNVDIENVPYCGAMRLCEAMVGQDGLGFHPDSRFAASGMDANPVPINLYPKPVTDDNRRQRKHTYIDIDKFKTAYLVDLYADQGVYLTAADPCETVICDVFGKVKGRETNAKLGLPILYYKADSTKLGNDPNINNTPGNIYDWRDNHDITGLRPAGVTERIPLYEGVTAPSVKTGQDIFYEVIRDKKSTITAKPYNENTYILISAGWDELYGTRDDVYNFGE